MTKAKWAMDCLLGIEDEPLQPHAATNFQTNKVGGKPDWMTERHENPMCKLCRRRLPLVVQIYAPLDESVNHRTLYIFGCINADCFNKPESWCCMRAELQDQTAMVSKHISSKEPAASGTMWLEEADDWGDNDEANDGDNGNSSNNNDNMIEGEPDLNTGLETMTLSSDSNANKGAEACSLLGPDSVSAEIETEDADSEPVIIDSPVKPTVNIGTLCSVSVPEEILNWKEPEFVSFHISVVEESSVHSNSYVDLRALELLADYQQREGAIKKTAAAKTATDSESYEKTKPGHGNDSAHKFVCRVKLYPEQLLRYSRQPDDSPLLLQPLNVALPCCTHCGDPLIFELQLMPHLSQRLDLLGFPRTYDPIEFSTVIVFACKRSCWTAGSFPREEHIIVQSDTL